jgi:hypothetical protein
MRSGLREAAVDQVLERGEISGGLVHDHSEAAPASRARRRVSHGVEDGIDTFVFRDGLIRAQTVSYTLVRKG